MKVVTDPLNVIFKPSVEAQLGYYTRSHDFAVTADYTSTALKYMAGVKLNEFLLPNAKLAVYYSGYNGTNRAYRPFVGGSSNTAGAFIDQNNGGATINQNLLYVEGNYYDLSFGYGVGNLSLNNVATPTTERGSVFKINYKVNF